MKATDSIKINTAEIRVNTYKIKTPSQEIKIVPLTEKGRVLERKTRKKTVLLT